MNNKESINEAISFCELVSADQIKNKDIVFFSYLKIFLSLFGLIFLTIAVKFMESDYFSLVDFGAVFYIVLLFIMLSLIFASIIINQIQKIFSLNAKINIDHEIFSEIIHNIEKEIEDNKESKEYVSMAIVKLRLKRIS